MDSDKQFEHLAERETELQALVNGGRRRALFVMIIAFLPIPLVLMKINDDRSLAGMIPIAIACRGDLVLLDEVAASARKTPSQSHSSDSTASGDGRPIAPCFGWKQDR